MASLKISGIKYIVLLLIGILITTCILVSCQTKSNNSRGPKYGGTLYINANDVPDAIFPGQVLKQSEQLIINQVYNGLVKYHPRTLEIVPAIAKSWLIEKQGTSYTFYINQDAGFHSDICFPGGKGRKILASDVKYSIEQICRNHLVHQNQISKSIKNIVGSQALLESSFPHDSGNISGIEAFNDSTLRITLSESDEMFIHFLAGTNCLVFAPEAFKKYGLKNTIGSGPYRIKLPESKGQPVVLMANDEYHLTNKQNEPLPFIDTIVISFIVSTSRELDLFNSGKLSAVFNLKGEQVTPFLDVNIDRFQSNPPQYIMKQISGVNGEISYNLLKSNVQNLDINPVGLFDFSEVFFQEPQPENIVVEP